MISDRQRNMLVFWAGVQITTYATYLLWKRRKSKRWRHRRWWVRPINARRNELGDFATLFTELKDDPDLFFRYTRMNVNTFYELLNLVSPYLLKHSVRESISPEQRLVITLHYLATGDQMFSVALAYRIGESTAHSIVKETCAVIANVLGPIYLPVPDNAQWTKIAQGFQQKWDMPNCVGAIDGKHVLIQAPPNSGSVFYNYKKTFSVVLMAACDSDYKFTLFDIGAHGGENDGSVLSNSSFGKALYNNNLNLPEGEKYLPGSDTSTPHYFVGDQAFHMSPQLMRPYPGRNLNEGKKIFNYRLSRARRTIENSFGILVSRWRVFRKAICAHPDTVDRIILATLCLHNFLKVKNDQQTMLESNLYCPPQYVDREINNGEIILGEWRLIQENNFTPMGMVGAHRASIEAYRIRDALCSYFQTPNGELPWQYNYVRRGYIN